MANTAVLALGEPVELFSVWDVIFGFLILLVLVSLVAGPFWLLHRRRQMPRAQMVALLVTAACGLALLIALLTS